MPNPVGIIEAVAGTLAETKLGKAAIDGVEAFVGEVLHSQSKADLTGMFSVPEGETLRLLGLGAKETPLKSLIESFKEPIPETLNTPNFLNAGKNEISSALDPARSQSLAIGLHEASKGWGMTEMVRFTPQVEGKAILPPVELVAQKTGSETARGSWGNGRAKLGEDAFLTPLAPKKAGTAVHEITHHEQGFLVLSRKADEMGISSAKPDKDTLQALSDEVSKSARSMFDTRTAARFMQFRNGRQLTNEAADRADKLITSFHSLWSRPSEFFGRASATRLNKIDSVQDILDDPKRIDEVKTLLQSLQDKEQGLKFMRSIFTSDSAELEHDTLLSHLPKGNAANWDESAMLKARDELEDTLDDAHFDSRQLQREWHQDYMNSLHEREARFNQFIGESALRERLRYFRQPGWHKSVVKL